jgi:Rrf2 family protein
MRISTKGEYGLRALFDLAQHAGEGPVQSAHIAQRQQIPENYLSQLLLIMRNSGLIRSIRGPQGGHMLARPALEINLAEVLTALEGPFLPIWRDLKAATDDVLSSTTLADLLQNRARRETEAMYYI